MSHDEQIQQITKKLHQISEKRYQNQRNIVKQEQMEQQFFEVYVHYRRLFDRLLHSWHKDRELRNWLEQGQSEIRRNERKMAYELESNKEQLLLEKQRLRELEDSLYYQRQALLQGEKE